MIMWPYFEHKIAGSRRVGVAAHVNPCERNVFMKGEEAEREYTPGI